MGAIPTRVSDPAYLASDHMTYLHEAVINNISKMVCWKSVILYDHLIINNIVIELHFAVYQIFKACFALRNFHSDDEGFPLRLFL